MQNENRPQFEIKNLNLKERDLNPSTQEQVRMYVLIKDSNLQDKGFESFNIKWRIWRQDQGIRIPNKRIRITRLHHTFQILKLWTLTVWPHYGSISNHWNPHVQDCSCLWLPLILFFGNRIFALTRYGLIAMGLCSTSFAHRVHPKPISWFDLEDFPLN